MYLLNSFGETSANPLRFSYSVGLDTENEAITVYMGANPLRFSYSVGLKMFYM